MKNHFKAKRCDIEYVDDVPCNGPKMLHNFGSKKISDGPVGNCIGRVYCLSF